MQPRSGVITIINATLRPPKIETGSSAVSSTLGCPGGTVIGCRGQHSRRCLSGVPMVCRGHKSLELPIKTPSRFCQGSRWAKEPKGFLMGFRFAVMLNMAANFRVDFNRPLPTFYYQTPRRRIAVMRPVSSGEPSPAGTRLTLFSDDKPDRFFTVIKFWMDETLALRS